MGIRYGNWLCGACCVVYEGLLTCKGNKWRIQLSPEEQIAPSAPAQASARARECPAPLILPVPRVRLRQSCCWAIGLAPYPVLGGSFAHGLQRA